MIEHFHGADVNGSSTREPHSRPPIGRMKRIDEWIRSGKYPNAVTMARELEVTDRTVKRDIEYMRDALQAPVEYDELKHGYYYSKSYEFLPVAAVTEAEMFALLIADKVIAQYKGMPFQKALRVAFRKLTGQLDSREKYSLENLGLAVSFRPFAPEDADLETLEMIARASRERRALKFSYRNLGTRQWQERHVHPYHVACIDSQWYLFGHDVGRGAIRTFALARLVKPTLTSERFVKPRDFDAEKYLAGSFSVMKGEKEQDVVIEFDAWATDLVSGRQWHSTQEFSETEDGGSRLKMRLNSLEEIVRWVLSWGTHARVLEPAALRERVRETAAKVAGCYC